MATRFIQHSGAWRTTTIGVLALLAGGLAWGPAPAAAADYPDHPLSLVVPYAPGGGVDTVGRIVAQGLGGQLGQSVVVENKPGAGSNIGSDFVAKAAPDGYTLLLASPATAVNVSLYKRLPFDPARDLRPITLVGKVPSVMIINNDLPAKTLRDFVALARKQPGMLNFGSGGNGTSEHLAGEMFKSMAGIDIVHVPYRGGAAVMGDLISGRISAIIINQITALPLIQAGKVRALAVADEQRSAALPDVPTFAEQGYPDYRVSVWWGVMTGSRVPAERVAKLDAGIRASLQTPAAQENFAKMGVQVLGSGPKEFGAFLVDETSRWSKIVKTSVEPIE
ncbi:MAG: tripartite tricarboxylate transporter substrate binding protein [Achromobacter sp.]|uniref:tripartite tricarboxylate transporter substrate binding protein n=1 Tax=Achromobacter sp. TaxID=134375 RepID=UPI00258E61B6|nr:tripartite tricarboxylate transporter substrate binding protein [Achromobacter sp.]MCW0211343.1 tripartite tricarboxylate transporter substrate binding protein [Achromobacter sp.]